MNRKHFIAIASAAAAFLAYPRRTEPEEWTVGSGMRPLIDGTFRIHTQAESGKFFVHRVTIYEGDPVKIMEIQDRLMREAKADLFEMVRNA